MRPTRLLPALVAIALLIGACGSDATDDGDSAAPADTTTTEPASADATTTTAVAEVITILVTNDDGIGAPGIDRIVSSLTALDDVEVVVVAPDENKSGSSDQTTDGGVTSGPGATASGFEGTAVVGFPADSVIVALDELGIEPDLVVSGVNEGQNVGPFAALSGTVGAARTAIRRGVPAVAASAGLGENADFEAAAALVIEWIEEHRTAIVDGSLGTDTVVSFNVPGCIAGDIGELVEVPLATEIPEGVNIFESDCAASTGDGAPADDVTAIIQGYAAETLVPADL